MSVSSEYTEDEEEEDFRDDMRVFLRLRPINKLEQSRRSKNCIELHEDPTLVTVDSPLEGEYDYTFDHIFEEIASQQEVYEESVATVPHALLEGFNCTVIAYGQTGTGKTHSMLGVNGTSRGLLQNTRSSVVAGKSVADISAFESQDETTKIAGNNNNSNHKHASISSGIGDALMDDDPECEGMIPRTVTAMFDLMQRNSGAMEYTIRVSYVEIYLEKILDLLHPHGGSKENIIIEEEADIAAGEHTTSVLRGASELCCLDDGDVLALLARGNACRTMSATEMNTESSRSHAIFIIRLHQAHRVTGVTKTSVLHMCDLAGSELASKEASNKRKSMVAATITSVQREAMMINKSLSALNKMIRAQLAHQHGEPDVPLDQIARTSKLTRLLRPSFGGNCLTTLLLTASPSSYNIGETISTINFGQRCRRIYNDPRLVQHKPISYYKKELATVKENYEDAMALARALAAECLKVKNGTSTEEGPLWETIQHLGQSASSEPLDFKVSIRKRKRDEGNEDDKGDESTTIFANQRVQLEDEIANLKEEREFMTRQHQDVEGTLAELQSEVAVLRTQNENLVQDKKRNVEELMHAKNEVQVLSQRKLEVEHNLRTSQFRENEAIVFLRQFRRFYRNVLKDKAAHGAGSILAITEEVTNKVPNAPTLEGLRDVDCLLVESGLLEEYEVNEDKSSGSYLPSKEALLRSATGAGHALKMAAKMSREGDMTDDDDGDSSAPYVAQTITRVAGPLRLPGPGDPMRTAAELASARDKGGTTTDEEEEAGNDADAGAGGAPLDDESNSDGLSTDTSMGYSIGRAPTTGTLVQRRQRALKTAAGRLVITREQTLDRELVDVRERCIDLQLALTEQLAIVDALTNKSGGLSKKRLAQEAISLRQQLEKKTASLTAIAWKMNELNLINKTYNEKMANREQHVLYLEEQLVELQNNNRRLIVDRAENEKRLREDNDNLQRVVGGMSVPLWQFGETDVRDKPLGTRIILTSNGGGNGDRDDDNLDQSSKRRRKSIGTDEISLEGPEMPLYEEYDEVYEPRQQPRDISMNSIESGASEDDYFEMDHTPPKKIEEPKRPKRRPSDKLRLSVNRIRNAKLFSAALAANSGDDEESIKSIKSSKAQPGVSIAIQTDDVQVFDQEEEVMLKSRALELIPPPPPVEEKPPMTDTGIQTFEVQVFDAGIEMEPARVVAVTREGVAQTDEVQIYDLHVSMVPEVIPPETHEVDVQTDIPELVDSDIQTDDVQVYDLETRMILYHEPPDMYEMNLQTDEVQVFDMSMTLAPMVIPPDTQDADIQTQEVQIFEMGKTMVVDMAVEKFHIETQTDGGDTCETAIQTVDVETCESAVQTLDAETCESAMQTLDAETCELAMQTDEEPVKEMHAVDVQTEDVEFVVHVETGNAQVQTDSALTQDAWNMTDDVESRGIGTMTDGEPAEEETLNALPRSLPGGGSAAAAVARQIVTEDDSESDSINHQETSEQERMDSDSNSSQEQHHVEQEHVDASASDGDYGFTSDDDSEAYLEAKNNDPSDTPSRDFSEERGGVPHSSTEADDAPENEESRKNDQSSESEDASGNNDATQDDQSSESEDAGENEELTKDDQSSEFDYEAALRIGTQVTDKSMLGTTPTEETANEVEPVLDVPTRRDQREQIQAVESTPGSNKPQTESRRRSYSPVTRFMPEGSVSPATKNQHGASRFMPQDSVSPATKSPHGASRFMPDNGGQNISRRPSNRRFLTNETANVSSRLIGSHREKAPTLLDAATDSGLGSNDELEYDDIGKRWGMSEDEIAADAAILANPRLDTGKMPSSSDVDDVPIVTNEPEEPEVLQDNSEDAFERELFDSDIDYLRRSSHSKESMERRLSKDRRLSSSRHTESDDAVSEANSLREEEEEEAFNHDDDFEKMMIETAAALAAADELVDVDDDDDDDDDEGGEEDNKEDSDDTEEENDSEVEQSDDNGEFYENDAGLDDEEVTDESLDAVDEKSELNDSSSVGERNILDPEPSSPEPEEVGPHPSVFVGGKLTEYRVLRFTQKLGTNIKPATVNPLSAKIQAARVEEGDGSIHSMSSARNREAPQRSPTTGRPPVAISQGMPNGSAPSSRSNSIRGESPHQKKDGSDSEDRRRLKKPSRSSSRTSSSRHHRSSSRRRVAGEGGRERSSRHITSDDGGERRRHVTGEGGRERSSRHITSDDGGERRRHRSSRHVDNEEGERRHRRSRRSIERKDGESRHKSRRGLEDKDAERRHKSRRNLEDSKNGDGHRQRSSEDGKDHESRERRHKSRRHLDPKDGDDEERRHRSSRRKSSDEDGDERRHRSSRRPRESGDEGGEERRHRSSRREGEGEDRERRRRKKREE